jgi:hypothetical protein
MARMARAVAPGEAHQVIQQGNRRQQALFSAEDYQAYLDLMAQWYGRCGVQMLAYYLISSLESKLSPRLRPNPPGSPTLNHRR